MTTLREAAQQALEAMEAADWYIDQLEMIVYSGDDKGTHEERVKLQAAITALRTALQTPPPPPEAQTDGEKNAYHYGWWSAMEAVREQRTEPEQQPVAWMCADEGLAQKGYSRFSRTKGGAWNIPVYTHPAPDDTALLRQALEALEASPDEMVEWRANHWEYKRDLVITALRERLEGKA
jgi:hypothetical protein